MKNLVTLLLLAIFSLPALSQSISIFDIDTTNFPTMKAKFYAFDKDGNIQRPSANELTLKENGVVRTIKSVNCPAPKPPVAISSVLVMDVSGSMGENRGTGVTNLELAKTAANSWVKGLPLGNSEGAITSFDSKNYLIQDFTNNKTKLIEAINKLIPAGGTNYDAAMIDKLAGGLLISQRAKYKKVIILLSDGLPNFEPKTAQIIVEARAQGCTIFCVTLGLPAPQCMKDIATQTGGNYFENVTTIKEAENVYSNILQQALGGEPCGLEWETGTTCNTTNIFAELTWNNFKTSINYTSPINSISSINVIPSFISFGKVKPNTTIDTVITFKAINSDFVINEIKIRNQNSNYSFKSVNFPINIPKNTEKKIILSYTPLDSNYTYASFEVITDICPTYFSANGGFPGKKIINQTLKLLKPNGGEEFIVGSDTLITWTGISPSDTVSLEYSIDSGSTWKLITDKALGLKYIWRNIPKPTSSKCLVRVKQLSDKMFIDNSVLILKGHKNTVFGVAFSPDGSLVVTGGWDRVAKIWDSYSGKFIKDLVGHNDGVSGVAFSPDGKKIITGGYDNTAKIWDVASGTTIHTLVGHTISLNGVSFSPDGKIVITASEDQTAKIWDVASGKLIRTLKGHTNYVEGVSFSPDGSKVATGSIDKTVKIWDVATGNLIKTLIGHKDRILYVFYSPDGTKVVSGSYDNTAIIWDVASGNQVRTLIGHTNAIVGVAYSPDGKSILTGSEDNTAKIWDANTGIVLQTLIGHTDWVFGVAFSPDGNRVITGSTDRNPRIWNLNSFSTLQSDISDSVFSIVAPSPLGRDVDMKECLVASVKDSVVSDFMQNVGSYRFRTDSIYFSGADASAFQLVSGIPRYELEPGKTKFAELRFIPKKVGKHTAKINIIAGGDTLVYNITGVGVQPMLQVVNNIIDFGKIKVGTSKDSIQANTIKNTGTVPITITKTLHAGPNDIDFTTLSGAAPFTLQPGETAKMNLRFNAKSRGRTSGQLKFEYNGVGSPTVVQLFAEGLPADTNCEGRSFVFRNFNLTSQVVKNGNSFITPDSTVRLTESKSNEVGGISYSEKVSLLSSFVMKFSFRFSNGVNSFMDGSLPGADGIAVLFQNGKGFRTTANGGSLGYDGIINCVALEMDMYRNSDYNDPNGNHVALQIPFKDTITSEHNAQRTFKMNENVFILRPDSTVYYGVVKFDANKKHLDFYLDSNKSANNLVMSVDDFDFSRHLKLEYGDFAYIGITGSTGASVQTHEILSWEFCSDRDEVLSVENGFYESEELVQSDNTISLSQGQIKSIKIIDFLGKTIFEEEVNTAKIDINKYNLSTGMYYIIAKDELGRSYFKKVSLVK